MKVSKKTKTYRYLTNLSSGLVGKKITVSDVLGGELGYTSMGNQIHVAYEHPIYQKLRELCQIMSYTLEMAETRVDMVRIGVTVHECLHQIFTNFSYEKSEIERLKSEGYFISDYDQYMYHQLMNLIEDPAIESMAHQVVGGMPLKALRTAIREIDRVSDYSQDAVDEIHDLTKALIQFGDIGIVKNKWTFLKAREVFLKIAPMFYDAINEPNGRKRIDAVRPILEEVRVLYREGAKPNKNADGSDEQLSRSSSPAGSGSGKSGKSSSKESEINRKRKITIKKVKRDEWEKMKKEAEEKGETKDDGKSDITVIIPEDAKAEDGKDGKEGASTPMPEEKKDKETSNKASGDSEEKDAKKEESDSESGSSKESADSPKDADDSSSDKGDASEGTDDSSKSHSDTSSSKNKEHSSKNEEGEDSQDDTSNAGETPHDGRVLDMSKSGHVESEEEANPFELTDEELEEMDDDEGELSAEEISKLEGMINSLLESALHDPTEDNREEMEQREEYNTHAEVVAKELHTRAKCVNTIMHATPNAEELYEKLIAPYEADVELLRKDLEEIFRNDSARDYYARSGSVSLKRMTSKVASTRLFERTERSSDKESIAIYMMVDMSGSTCGSKIVQERLAAILTAEALAGFNIPLFITGFTDRSEVEFYHFVRGENTEEERYSLLQIEAKYNNFDAYVVRYAEEMLKARTEKRKLFIMISDGQPASTFSGGMAGVRQNAEAVEHMKEEGINVLAFGVGNIPQTVFEYMYGNAFINVSNISQLFDKLADALRVAINGEEY